MYKVIIKNVLLTFIAIILINFVSAQNYLIRAQLTGFKNGSKVYLKNDLETQLNSTQINRGMFDLAGFLKGGPQYVSIVIHEDDEDFKCTVFASQNVMIKGSKKDFPYNISITGPMEQVNYNHYQNAVRALNIKSDNLMKLIVKAHDDSIATRKAAMAYNVIGDQFRRSTKKWIFNHQNTYASANLLYDYLSELSKKDIDRFYNSFSYSIKQSIYGKRIYTYLNIGDTLKIGDQAYNFEAYTSHGNKHTLTDMKGKYVLLDFSTVHCEHCEDSQNEMRRIYDKYKDRLNVVSLTPDTRIDWINGIKAGHVTWLSLNDGQSNYSQTLLKYNIQAYPSFYLVAPDGIIADKWIGYENLPFGLGDIEKHLVKFINK